MSEYVVERSSFKFDFKGKTVTVERPINYKEEVIRCRDCKHSWCDVSVEYDSEYTCHEIEQLFCTHPKTTEPSSLEVDYNGFCAWGKRRH